MQMLIFFAIMLHKVYTLDIGYELNNKKLLITNSYYYSLTIHIIRKLLFTFIKTHFGISHTSNSKDLILGASCIWYGFIFIVSLYYRIPNKL